MQQLHCLLRIHDDVGRHIDAPGPAREVQHTAKVSHLLRQSGWPFADCCPLAATLNDMTVCQDLGVDVAEVLAPRLQELAFGLAPFSV